MFLRRLISNLGTAEARQGAIRTLAASCAVGYALTLVVLASSGVGLRRWFFALLVWGALIYIPLRILVEAAHTMAPGLRHRLITQTATQAGRYTSRRSIELVVEGLLEQSGVMPRIATPAQHAKAKAGAVALLDRTRGDSGQIERAAVRCLATTERWVAQLAAWSADQAPSNIQSRWAEVRALASLAAATKVLIAAYQDGSGHRFAAGVLDGSGAVAFLDTCLDFCDQLALEADVLPWTEPALRLTVEAEICARTRAAWMTFSDYPPPALAARAAVVDAVLGAAPARS